MSRFFFHQPVTSAGVLLVIALGACSGDSGPIAGQEPGRLSGYVIGNALGAGAALAGDSSSEEPLAGLSVRLVSGSGEILFESGTDSSGEFGFEAPAGSYRLEISMGDGTIFTLQVELEAGHTLFVQGNVDTTGSTPIIDAEIFIDDDGDGVSDTGFTIQIVGREAGDPDSGEVTEEGDPDEDLEDEEDGEEDEPAELADLEEGQKVFVKGEGIAAGFEADEVHGSAGHPGRSCRLSGEITSIESFEDDLTTVGLFAETIDVSSARITGVRGGASGLLPGIRVEIHASYDAGSGELTATRLHARGTSQGHDPERIHGFLTAEPDAEGGILEVCGIRVEISDDTRITNGDGHDSDGGAGEDDADEEEDDDATSFQRFVAALADGGGNHDIRGEFDDADGVLRADHMTLNDEAAPKLEIVADVADLDPGAGTFTLMGVPVAVGGDTEFRGSLDGVQDLSSGLHLKVQIGSGEGGLLIAAVVQRAGEPFDRLRGGTLEVVSADLASAPNFSVGLPEGTTVAVDADGGTAFAIED